MRFSRSRRLFDLPVLEGVVGERTLVVLKFAAFKGFGTSFEVGDNTGVVGESGDLTEKLEASDLQDVALCGLSNDVLGSDGVFCYSQKYGKHITIIVSMIIKKGNFRNIRKMKLEYLTICKFP